MFCGTPCIKGLHFKAEDEIKPWDRHILGVLDRLYNLIFYG